MGRVTKVTLPGGLTSAVQFDVLGQPAAITSPNGNTWTMSNDALGRSTATSVKEKCKALGLTLVGDQAYDRGLTDFRPTLNNFKSANPDIVTR